jgi:hypothetical protein
MATLSTTNDLRDENERTTNEQITTTSIHHQIIENNIRRLLITGLYRSRSVVGERSFRTPTKYNSLSRALGTCDMTNLHNIRAFYKPPYAVVGSPTTSLPIRRRLLASTNSRP